MKQSKLRRKRVFRYAVLYFVMLVVFVGLVVGPIFAGKKIPESVTRSLKSTDLIQPVNLDNNDTDGHVQTGTGRPGYSGAYTAPAATSSASQTSANKNKIRLL